MRALVRSNARDALAGAGALALALLLCLLTPGLFLAHACTEPGLGLLCMASTGPAIRDVLPMVVLTIGGAILALGVALVAEGIRHARLVRSLDRVARVAVIQGAEVRLVPLVDGALVAGLALPRIYCADDIAARLDDDELRAVIAHERHHQLTFAPLWLVSLSALGAFLRWSGAGRRWLVRRRAAVEIAADRHALANGVSRRLLARALVKLMGSAPTLAGAGFASAADLRLAALLDEAPTPPRSLSAAAFLPLGFLAACLLGMA